MKALKPVGRPYTNVPIVRDAKIWHKRITSTNTKYIPISAPRPLSENMGLGEGNGCTNANVSAHNGQHIGFIIIYLVD
jgi:hypothetical protein